MLEKINHFLDCIGKGLDDINFKDRQVVSVYLLCIFIMFTFVVVTISVEHYRNIELQNEVAALLNENEELNKQVWELNIAKNDLEKEVAEKDNQINELEIKLNERDWTDYWTKELLIKLADNHKEIYYMRNEIMYWDFLKWGGEKTKVQASYEALWMYVAVLENDIDPYLLTAIGIVENGLHHTTTRNNKNAVGWFQLTPIVEMGYGVNGEIFEENVIGAGRFLKRLTKQYNGDLIGILGHYNGGSRPYHAVENYPETKKYVPDVLMYYEVMANRYGYHDYVYMH